MFYQDRLETAISAPRKFRMVLHNFCYYFWGKDCCWRDITIFLFFMSLYCPQIFHCPTATIASLERCDRRHSTLVLRPEIPSGMCAKLRTVAASNNRDHQTRSLYYCLIAPHTYIFVLRAHPVRGESYNQRNSTGEVTTLGTLSSNTEMCTSTAGAQTRWVKRHLLISGIATYNWLVLISVERSCQKDAKLLADHFLEVGHLCL